MRCRQRYVINTQSEPQPPQPPQPPHRRLTVGAAKQRRERRLRMHWRHEQLSLRMALAAATHHSAQPRAKEAVEGETYDAPRRQKPPPPGTQPASLAEPRGDVVQVQRHTVQHLADGAPCLPTLGVPVPQMVDQPVDILKIVAKLSPAVAADGGTVGGHALSSGYSCCRAGYRRAQDHPGPHPAALGAFGASAAGGTAGGSASALCPRGHDHGTVRGNGWNGWRSLCELYRSGGPASDANMLCMRYAVCSRSHCVMVARIPTPRERFLRLQLGVVVMSMRHSRWQRRCNTLGRQRF